jgi:hypothetical protein
MVQPARMMCAAAKAVHRVSSRARPLAPTLGSAACTPPSTGALPAAAAATAACTSRRTRVCTTSAVTSAAAAIMSMAQGACGMLATNTEATWATCPSIQHGTHAQVPVLAFLLRPEFAQVGEELPVQGPGVAEEQQPQYQHHGSPELLHVARWLHVATARPVSRARPMVQLEQRATVVPSSTAGRCIAQCLQISVCIAWQCVHHARAMLYTDAPVTACSSSSSLRASSCSCCNAASNRFRSSTSPYVVCRLASACSSIATCLAVSCAPSDVAKL